MNEEQIKKLIQDTIRDEIGNILRVDRYLFKNNIQIFDARNIQFGRENGTKLGTANDQKVAFFGETPVSQQSAISDPGGGATVDSEARTAIASILDVLQNLGIIAT